MAKLSAHTHVHSKLVSLLQKHREKIGMSMTELAQKAGLSLSMISFVERELRKPTFDTLLRIAEALNVDLWKPLRAITVAASKA